MIWLTFNTLLHVFITTATSSFLGEVMIYCMYYLVDLRCRCQTSCHARLYTISNKTTKLKCYYTTLNRFINIRCNCFITTRTFTSKLNYTCMTCCFVLLYFVLQVASESARRSYFRFSHFSDNICEQHAIITQKSLFSRESLFSFTKTNI